jgi:hypothetical protein
VFRTAAEARDYLRKPQIEAALRKISGGDANLAQFLYENEDEICKAFEAGVVARVTKADRKKLQKALDAIVASTDINFKFVQDNHQAIMDSFRWPSVKRMTEEEKTAATQAALAKLADDNAAKWIIKNQEAIHAAYNAGIEKRAVNPKAAEALAKYQAERAANKAAAEPKAA